MATPAFWLMYLFDIAEAANLPQARLLCGASPEPGPFPSPSPAYAGFENPPVVGSLTGGPPGAQNGAWKLFEYGVLCIEWEIPCQGSWSSSLRKT